MKKPFPLNFPAAIAAALIALLVAVAAGCGDESDGSGEATTAAASEQVEDAAQLAMIRAHQIASLRLYEKGQIARAAKHAGHPAEEIFFALSRTLRSKDAALTADLREALGRSTDLVLASAPLAEVEASFEQAWQVLDRAEASLVPDDVRGTATFRAQTIASLLGTVGGEYAEAVDGGRVAEEIEYQDAWGALTVAGSRFSAVRGELADRAAGIATHLADLRGKLPGVESPPRPAGPEKVQRSVDAAVDELNEVAG